MTTIPPTISPTGAAAATAPPPTLTLAGSAPADLAALPAGTTIEATILPQTGAGPMQVETALGPLALRKSGDLPLPAGAQLTLQIARTGGGAVAFRVVAVNGRALTPGGTLAPTAALDAALVATDGALANGTVAGANGMAKAGATPDPALTSASANVETAAAPPTANGAPAGLTATVLRPAAGETAPTALPAGLSADLAPGTQVTVRIAAVTPPEPTAAAMPVPAAAAEPAPSAPVMPMPIPIATDPAAPVAPTMPTIPTAAPPGSAEPLPAAPLPIPPPAGPDMLPGVVLTRTPVGQSLVQTPAGTLLMPAASDLPAGAQVQLKIMAPPVPPTNAPATATPATGATHPALPALNEALTVLTGSDPAAAQQMLSALPQFTPALAANLSLFAGALESGDMSAILNPKSVQGLQRAGRRDLADKLKGDLADLADESARPLGKGEWRAFTIPVIGDQMVHPVRLVVRRAPSGDGSGGTGGPAPPEHRFVLDFRLSRLGRIQLDGLVQRESRRFDLIIRTATPLPQEMRRDIMGLFAACSDAVGTKGGVVFQGGGRFIDPAPAEGGTTVTA